MMFQPLVRVFAWAFAAVAFHFAAGQAKAAEAWPGKSFATVRAFAWPATEGTSVLVEPDLTTAPGAIDAEGKLLTDDQVARLIAASTRPRPPGRTNIALCVEPHYAFIFYDRSGRPVAFVELSIRYRGYRISPDVADLEPHYGDLASLCRELGLPFEKGFSLEDYRAQFENTFIRGAGFEGAD